MIDRIMLRLQAEKCQGCLRKLLFPGYSEYSPLYLFQ